MRLVKNNNQQSNTVKNTKPSKKSRKVKPASAEYSELATRLTDAAIKLARITERVGQLEGRMFKAEKAAIDGAPAKKTPGQIACEAYSPNYIWSRLPTRVKECWETAAKAVVDSLLK